MVDHWNNLLTNPSKLELFKERFTNRYKTPHDKIAKSILWIPTDSAFYRQVNDIIAGYVLHKHPIGDCYLPGYDERQLNHLALSAKFEASLQEAIIVYFINDRALDTAKINLSQLIIEQADDNWLITSYGVNWLCDLLALRFLPATIFLNHLTLLNQYFTALNCCIKQIAKCKPKDSLQSVSAYKHAIKLLHDTILLDLISFDRSIDTDYDVVIHHSIFCLGLLPKKTIDNEKRLIIERSFSKLFSALQSVSYQLLSLFNDYIDSTRNAIRLLDPYCYLFISFMADNKKEPLFSAIFNQLAKPPSDLSPDSDAALMLVSYSPQKKNFKSIMSGDIPSAKALYDNKTIKQFSTSLEASVATTFSFFEPEEDIDTDDILKGLIAPTQTDDFFQKGQR